MSLRRERVRQVVDAWVSPGAVHRKHTKTRRGSDLPSNMECNSPLRTVAVCNADTTGRAYGEGFGTWNLTALPQRLGSSVVIGPSAAVHPDLGQRRYCPRSAATREGCIGRYKYMPLTQRGEGRVTCHPCRPPPVKHAIFTFSRDRWRCKLPPIAGKRLSARRCWETAPAERMDSNEGEPTKNVANRRGIGHVTRLLNVPTTSARRDPREGIPLIANDQQTKVGDILHCSTRTIPPRMQFSSVRSGTPHALSSASTGTERIQAQVGKCAR